MPRRGRRRSAKSQPPCAAPRPNARSSWRSSASSWPPWGSSILAVARVLAEFVRPERAARLRGVFATRLDSVTVVMDAPHDPHNGAAVIRSCDAFGVQRLHVIERLEPFLAASSVARGSERWVDVRTTPTWRTPSPPSPPPVTSWSPPTPTAIWSRRTSRSIPRLALVLGNERNGIVEQPPGRLPPQRAHPHARLRREPDVSVTAAILLQHATAGRPGDPAREERDLLYARALVLTVPHAAEILAAKGIRVEIAGRAHDRAVSREKTSGGSLPRSGGALSLPPRDEVSTYSGGIVPVPRRARRPGHRPRRGPRGSGRSATPSSPRSRRAAARARCTSTAIASWSRRLRRGDGGRGRRPRRPARARRALRRRRRPARLRGARAGPGDARARCVAPFLALAAVGGGLPGVPGARTARTSPHTAPRAPARGGLRRRRRHGRG